MKNAAFAFVTFVAEAVADSMQLALICAAIAGGA